MKTGTGTSMSTQEMTHYLSEWDDEDDRDVYDDTVDDSVPV